MSRLLCGLTAAAAVGVATGAGAQPFDAVADFSTTTNTDTSTWSYRDADDLSRDGVYDLLVSFETDATLWEPDLGAWRASDGGRLVPGIGVNQSGGGATFTANSNAFVWPDDTIWMHTNPGSMIMVSWLAPQDGLVDLAFRFDDIDPNTGANGSDGAGWFVDLGDSTGNLDASSFPNGGTSGARTVDGVAVSAGDRIHFIVADTTSNFFFDSTSLVATVEYVPEPGSLAVVGLGGLLLGRRRR